MGNARCRRSLARWITVLSALVLYTSCTKNPLAPDVRGDNEVWIQVNGFEPATLTVTTGTTVKWTNRDDTDHSVDSGAPMNPTTAFHSPNLSPKQSWSRTFQSRGTFNYFCVIHGNKPAKIVVQ